MKTIKFECEVIAPMFLAGANGKTPELRPPSIKGSMRFWWRAMNGHLPIDKLKGEEGMIFGSSDVNMGRSKFSIRTLGNNLKINKYSPLPHKITKGFEPKLDGISCGQKISIILSCRHGEIDRYADILKASLILGGLGKRSRRGFGSVRILNVDGQPCDFNYTIEAILKLINCIGDNKYAINKHEGKIELQQKRTAQYPFLKEIQFGKEYESWEDLIKHIGEASHNHDIYSLGFADNKKRLASPVYVSVLKNQTGKYLPIISNLNTVFCKDSKMTIDYKGQNAFKEEIL